MRNYQRQLGRFTIPMTLVRNSPGAVMDALHMIGFLPTKVEALYHSGEFEYIGMSNRFSVVPCNEQIKDYRVAITVEKAGNVSLVEVYQIDKLGNKINA